MNRIFLFTLAIMTGQAFAQVYTPQAPQAPAQDAPVRDSSPQQPRQQKADSPFGNEFPMLDPSAETITFGGMTMPISDNRILKARFEKYLNQPPESGEDAEEYRKNIEEILAALSPFAEGGPSLNKGFRTLPSAAAYPGDAKICSTLAEAIYTALLAKSDTRKLKSLNIEMEKEKQKIIRRGDWDARTDKASGVGDTRRANTTRKKGESGPTQEGRGSASLQYKEKLRRITEIEALKKTNVVKSTAKTIQTKTQYQMVMAQWFVQRRFEHVIMAGRFYNQIWKDGDSKLRIKQSSDLAKIFSNSLGVSPTVTSLDSLSNEAIREVRNYIEAFDLLVSRGDLHSASQRLMEAYYIGEFLEPVATLPLEKKQKIADYVRDLSELYGTIQARDYTRAKVLVTRMKESARDFPSSKVDSAIAGYTLASDLAVENAKMHLLSQDTDKAAEKIQEAAEIWPTNPKLTEFREMVSNSSAFIRNRNDFDRLLSEGNYREIARRQYEIAPTLQGDEPRQDAFRQIMGNLTTIETALGKAQEFIKIGQNYGAWEQLAEIREKFPNDPKLGREMELLAPKVADFTLALDKAQKFESRTPRQTGSALSWFLKARSIHPQSQQATEGIERMLDIISQ